MLHDAIAFLVAALCLWAIISHRVPTGVLITTGLGAIFVVAVWSVDDGFDHGAAFEIMLGALGLIGAGVAWRCGRRYPRPMRRVED